MNDRTRTDDPNRQKDDEGQPASDDLADHETVYVSSYGLPKTWHADAGCSVFNAGARDIPADSDRLREAEPCAHCVTGDVERGHPTRGHLNSLKRAAENGEVSD